MTVVVVTASVGVVGGLWTVTPGVGVVVVLLTVSAGVKVMGVFAQCSRTWRLALMVSALWTG